MMIEITPGIIMTGTGAVGIVGCLIGLIVVSGFLDAWSD